MRKAVILVVILGIALILSALGLVVLHLMTNEARIAEHKIRRMQAYYAAKAGMVYVLERLGREGTAPAVIAAINQQRLTINNLPVQITVRQRENTPDAPCPATAPSDFCINIRVEY